MMEFVNAAYKWKEMPREVAEPFVKLLNPYAPHLAGTALAHKKQRPPRTLQQAHA